MVGGALECQKLLAKHFLGLFFCLVLGIKPMAWYELANALPLSYTPCIALT